MENKVEIDINLLSEIHNYLVSKPMMEVELLVNGIRATIKFNEKNPIIEKLEKQKK